MWHASISSHGVAVPVDALRRAAHAELAGVGDSTLGEWEEVGEVAFHLRRRLTPAEQAHVGPAVDVRGTWEATKRRSRVERWIPAGLPEEVRA